MAFRLRQTRGSTLVLVLVVFVCIIIFYFAMDGFVASRTLQVNRVIRGIQAGNAARAALLMARESTRTSLPSLKSASTAKTVTAEGFEVTLYFDELHARETMWYSDGEHALLEAIYYLAEACENEVCWVALGKDTYGPRPSVCRADFAAEVSGYGLKAVSPLRQFSGLFLFAPEEVREVVKDSCTDFNKRECRQAVYARLDDSLRQIRQKEFELSPLTNRIRQHYSDMGPQVSEFLMQKTIQGLDQYSSGSRPDLYWAAATLDRLIRPFPGPISEDRFSLRAPVEPEPQPEAEALLKKFFAVNRQGQPQADNQEMFFHARSSAIRHFVAEQKLDSRIYEKPTELRNWLEVRTGLHQYVLEVNRHCVTGDARSAAGLLRMVQGYEDKSNWTRECNGTPMLEVKPVLKGKEIRSSSVVAVDNKALISLVNYFDMLSASGGINRGSFPENEGKEQYCPAQGAAQKFLILPAWKKPNQD